MGSVYRRGRTWWIRFTHRGKEVRKPAKTTSKAVAQRYLYRLMEEAGRIERGGRPRRTFRETIERFATDYLPTIKPTTQTRYRVSLRQIEPFFKGLFLDQITRGRLADYISARKKKGVTDATIRRDLACLSIVLTCAVGWDYIDFNVVRTFNKRVLKEAPPRVTYPTDAELAKLIRSTSSPMAARIIAFLAQTGMRQEEVCSLEWGQVNLERREVRLIRTKTSSPRIVPLSQDALGTLLGTPRHPTSAFVFWHDDGQRYTQFATIFAKIAFRASVRHTCHSLRHRFASRFLERGGDIPSLQSILGHRSITMTMRYSHLATAHLHAVMRRIEAGESALPPQSNP